MLEAPGGLIEAVAACRNGRVERVRVRNVPSFVDRLDAVLEVEGLGTLAVDTAYGGDSFAIVDAHALGFSLTPDEARDIAVTGVGITRAANEQLGFTHPGNPDWSHISFCQMAAPVEVRGGVKMGRNAVAIRPGRSTARRAAPDARRGWRCCTHGATSPKVSRSSGSRPSTRGSTAASSRWRRWATVPRWCRR